MQRGLELRKVPAGSLNNIAEILEINEDWKRVLSLIPKDLQGDHFEPKYNSEHMRLIEEHALNTSSKCAKVLFDEWGTSGRVRPTVETLLSILARAQIFRAADDLAHQLNENPPPRPPDGPAADVLTSITSLLNNESVEQTSNVIKSNNPVIATNGTNGTFRTLDNDATKQMISSNLMHFSKSETQNEVSDMMKFSETSIDTQNQNVSQFPDFDALFKSKSNVEGVNTNSSMLSSTVNSETSYPSNVSGPSEQESQFKHSFQIPSNIKIYDQIYTDILADSNLTQFEYKELQAVTNNFTDKQGSGGFGDVFKGSHQKFGMLAVKKAHNLQFSNATVDVIKIFNTEVKSLSILRHENIVPMLGFCLDGPAPCIVCQYIDGGSLLQKIAAKELNEKQRMDIMIGTAEGLKYIHNTVKPTSGTESMSTSARKAYFLHGDVKSANILLTQDCVPKLCDFGLSKQYDTTFITRSIMGTSAYMAPESFSGTITQKSDIFSYGIVVLELLTGRPPIITENNETINIKNYVEDNCPDNNISSVLDPLVIDSTKAQKVYELVLLCLVMEKKNRPAMDVICETLHKINDTQQKVFYAQV